MRPIRFHYLFVTGIVVLLSVLPGLLDLIDINSGPHWKFVKESRFYLIGLLLITYSILELKKAVSEYPDAKALKNYLDKVHLRYFCDANNKFDQRVRISLHVPKFFLFKLSLPPFGKLCLLERSGIMYRGSDAKWSKERSKSGAYHGVVGYVWATGTEYNETNLGYSTSKRKLRHYKAKTHLSDEDLARLSMKAESILSVPIQDKNGRNRGVFTIESEYSTILGHQCSGLRQRTFDRNQFDDILENIQCIFTE